MLTVSSAAEVVHRDVVDGEAGIARDHHDALAHALIVARDRHCGEGEVGVAECLADRVLRLALDLLDAVDRKSARHLYDGVDEMRRPDHAHAQPLDVDDARHGADRGGRLLLRALRRAVDQGFDGGAGHAQAEQRDHHGDRDRRRRIAPPEAEAGEHEAGDHGNRAEYVGGKMQRVGRKRLAVGLARGAMQGARAPEIDGDVDHEHDERNGRNGRRRCAFAQPAIGLDQDAAGQHIEQRDDAERREALELAVAVMMLLVRRLIGHPHHRPGDDGRDQVDRGVQGFGDQRQRADRDPDHELGRGHAAAGEDRNRGDRGFGGVRGWRSWAAV